jgi:hypothetical protein
MNVFIFQSVPERFDLRKAIRVGKRDTWYATRYRNDMHAADLVFFWMAGDEHFRGLYGWGRLAGAPRLETGWGSHGVDVTYEVKFERPILATSLRDDPALADLLIFRAPQACPRARGSGAVSRGGCVVSGHHTESRRSVIAAITTPLSFLVLGLLVVEGTVGSLALALAELRPPLVWTVIASIPAFVLTVVGLAVWRPEALRGDRPLQGTHAQQFASDLFLSLDGALSNLEPIERAEAWLTVADVITSGSRTDASYSEFCSTVAEKLKTLTNLTNRTLRSRGPIEP